MLAAEAKATLGDVHAFTSHNFDPNEFASLPMPVLFLYGGESPPIQTVATDALLDVIPTASKLELTGVGHDGMFTDPSQFVDKITTFLLD
jgi:pimeloyl-ACP methyl ester carboxylesterase